MKKVISIILILFAISTVSNAAPHANSDPVVDGFNKFAFKLYQKVEIPNQNIIISPYSLSSLLGILTIGASGDTQNQFLHLLNLNNTTHDAIMMALDKLNQSFMPNNKAQNFIVANALWAASNLSYKQSFLDLTQKSKFINFYTLNFAADPEAAQKAGIINA